MLCPEVWNFATEKRITTCQNGNYDNKSRTKLDKLITNNCFNHMVSIILPGHKTIPDSVEELIKASDYYLVKDLSISELVRKDFIEAFIKRGRFTGISLEADTAVDIENKIFVTPDGKLNILVCKDLYQTLGLEGRPAGKSKERFEIIIDLKNNFLERPKLYNRIKTALTNAQFEPFDFRLTWESSIDPNICPSSIAKFFKDSGYKVEQHGLQVQLTQRSNIKIPNEVFSGRTIDSVTANQVAEYFAYIMLDCESNFIDKELSSYEPSFNLDFSDAEQLEECIVLHCKGLMTSHFLLNLLETLRDSNDSKVVVFNVIGEQLIAKGCIGQTFGFLNDKKYFIFSS